MEFFPLPPLLVQASRDHGSLFKLLIYKLAVSALLVDSSKPEPNWDANVSPGSQALLLSPGEGSWPSRARCLVKRTPPWGSPPLWGEKDDDV